MHHPAAGKAFVGAIPQVYEQYMVPLMFEPYARDLAARVVELAPLRVLELAAGTGVLTRALSKRLAPGASIVATDLNPQMIEQGIARGTDRPVDWRQVDAMALPFGDASFDLVVCQFGVMFFPDKPLAFAGIRRVLREGGHLLFSTWDGIERNAFAATVLHALKPMFPSDPPSFLARVPHGYHDQDAIRADLLGGGFESPVSITAVSIPTIAATAHIAAVALCQGTPMRAEIEARDPQGLERATELCEAALKERFGPAEVSGESRAYVVAVEK